MAYMLMLVVNDTDQLNAVMKAWDRIHVNDIVFMDSVCFHRYGDEQAHVPMRYMFERLELGRRQYSVTMFGIVKDKAVVQQCIVQAETVIGDLEAAKNVMLVAWPLPIIKSFAEDLDSQGETE